MSAVADGPSTRDRILAEALAAFADRGVEATSLDSIAAEVGVRKQTLLYWFPSKEQLLFAVVDHTVAELGARFTEAVLAAEPTLDAQVRAVVDTTFRLGTTHPELLAVVREIARLGPPASTRLATAADPLVDLAASRLATPTQPNFVSETARSGEIRHEVRAQTGHRDVEAERARLRRVLLAAGAQVVGLATEAEVRADLGLAPDRAWLRARRRALLESLRAELT